MLEIFESLKEQKNAKEIAKIRPYIIFYDVQNQFAKQQQPKGKIPFKSADHNSFTDAVLAQPFVENYVFNSEKYDEYNPQNQVLIHGIIYNALFDTYIKHIKKAFDDKTLRDLQKPYMDKKLIIESDKYEKLPRNIRGIFVKYDDNHYMMNAPYDKMTIAYNKKNKPELERLLKRAKILLNRIYREPTPNEDCCGIMQIYDSPAFIPDDYKWVNRVFDNQLCAIRELHDIFIKISQITFPRATTPTNKRPACDIFREHIKNISHKNLVYDANQMYKQEKRKIYTSISQKNHALHGKDINRILKQTKNNTNIAQNKAANLKFFRWLLMRELEQKIKM